ncbi:MAG TPA: F0F1 ATP synthase subunit A [Wolbachia sp.]|uniref:F0F1 ATP synthase subunit A n=1 Tax=Wolbachia endosymbiont of Pentalonia nigronervosa TaxID=1301914 RepID=UPI000EE655ED|nr:F0F1 ATP synthase subunit A [Wolbachia endosymbiont of Pentalonia nigronervosa]MBD0390973.1 F0F1 ATP synthase subunit A [Wolbachia endosymbiont of Pentalonia nigronervosa]HCE59585.1 F0F1 ATP synthase subunit A [Wolbachia sp.]
MALNPLDQFRVYTLAELPNLFGYDISFTNSSLFMMISVILAAMFLLIGVRKNSGYFQASVEYIYEFVVSIIEGNTGSKGLNHIPLIFTVFIFILSCNLVGILPYAFTVTSHISVTFALSMIVFIYVTVVGFKERGLEFLSIFLPKGTPPWLAWLIVIIKLFAYLVRPVSLSVRLAANMVAGHTIIKVIAWFIVNMNIFLTPIPFFFVVALIGFEVFVAILQAYIFTILTCVYLSDAVK